MNILSGRLHGLMHRKFPSVEYRNSPQLVFYSCTAHFSTKIVPQDKTKLANAHFTRLCELVEIIQTQ